MGKLIIATNLNIDLEFSIPPFFLRIAAWFIDASIVFTYLFIAMRIKQKIDFSYPDFANQNGWTISLIIILPLSLYPIFFEWLLNGQTIGKKITGLRVININGSKASLSQLIIRWMMRVSDLFIIFILLSMLAAEPAILQGLGFFLLLLIGDVIAIATTQKSQRIGDILAGTILISTGQKKQLDETVFIKINENYKPVFNQVMNLTDVEITRIKNIYEEAVRKNDLELAYRTAQKIQKVLNIHEQINPFDFIDTILKDYNYYAQQKH